MNYNGSEYFYITNLQGDVIELVDMTGNTVATYKYDAWGNTISKTGSIADINPYRYRGYRFDTETGYYYLQSRYYNPQIGRFISADGILGETGDLITQNMYAYAGNNPVMNIDPDGYFAIELAVSVSLGLKIAVAAIAIYTITYVVSNLNDGSITFPSQDDFFNNISNTVEDINDDLVELATTLAGLNITNWKLRDKYDLHHIIAKNDKRAYFSRFILEKADIDINDSRNTVYVNKPMHWVMHTNTYHASVTVIVWAGYSINGEQGVIDALRGMKDIIEGISHGI